MVQLCKEQRYSRSKRCSEDNYKYKNVEHGGQFSRSNTRLLTRQEI